MGVRDERELLARVSAADESAHKCIHNHAIVGNNVYRDGVGHRSCLLCRIERARETKRDKTPSRRRARVPLDPALVQSLRERAGITAVGPADGGLCAN